MSECEGEWKKTNREEEDSERQKHKESATVRERHRKERG